MQRRRAHAPHYCVGVASTHFATSPRHPVIFQWSRKPTTRAAALTAVSLPSPPSRPLTAPTLLDAHAPGVPSTRTRSPRHTSLPPPAPHFCLPSLHLNFGCLPVGEPGGERLLSPPLSQLQPNYYHQHPHKMPYYLGASLATSAHAPHIRRHHP